MGEMTRHIADAGSYAPVTILIQELPDGGSRVAYDSVASAIAPYHDAAASKVARRLDAEVLTLLREVTGVSAPRPTLAAMKPVAPWVWHGLRPRPARGGLRTVR